MSWGAFSRRASPKSWASRSSSRMSPAPVEDRKSTRLNSSHANISYAVFCLKKKNHPKVAPVPPAQAHDVRVTRWAEYDAFLPTQPSHALDTMPYTIRQTGLILYQRTHMLYL